ncbi:glycosyltransferase family 2 protein, partial [Candidatus Magnetaquicoccus inordinatus]|uniref:glycosyltransferase family 2 protein n=1 Tax=Candidatus Magnetaquicoccus inordinatus TaxID=2496818 RepID=UPI00187D4CC3
MSPPSPAISAIVVSYHTGLILQHSLQAILQASGLLELLVVDNGNPPSTQRWLDHWACSDQRIRLLRPGRNIGFAGGVNQAAAIAQGDCLALINPDLLVEKETLAQLAAALQQKTHVWIVGARLLNWDGTEQRGGRRAFLTPW